MSDMSRAARNFFWGTGLAAAFVLVYALAYVPLRARFAPSMENSLSRQTIRTPEVSASDRRDHRFQVAVPELTPGGFLSSTAHTVKQGDVIEFVVTSGRPGAVAVHGLFEPQSLASDRRVTVAFRAIYSGRFALHFHGNDGSHFELIVLNVMPADVTKDR